MSGSGQEVPGSWALVNGFLCTRRHSNGKCSLGCARKTSSGVWAYEVPKAKQREKEPKANLDSGPASGHAFSEGKGIMSAPARQTRNVDSMRDDPERLLDVSEAAALLHVKRKTLYAWVSRNKIPYRKICSLVRFHRGELIEWAKGQQQNTSKATSNALTVVK